MFSAGLGPVTEARKTVVCSLAERLTGCDFLRNFPGLEGNQNRLYHNKNRDIRVDFKFMRERPIGPHKHRTQNIIPDNRVSRTIDYHKKVHYPADGKYTIKRLEMTKMGGRHPETGIKVIGGVGGGAKRKWRWIDWNRLPKDWPTDGTVLEERIISIHYDPNRDAKIALTGYGDHMRWQIATNKMNQGDIIRTHTEIPVNPIRPKEGDAHPLGALPIGTSICQVEAWPGEGAYYMVKAEEEAKIIKKVDNRVVVKCWDRLEFAIPETAMCVVGTNSIHPLRAMPIGSPNRLRWLGMTPRSGLFKKKGPRMGRKSKRPPPTINTMPYEEFMKDVGTASSKAVKGRSILLTADSEGKRGQKKAGKRYTPLGW